MAERSKSAVLKAAYAGILAYFHSGPVVNLDGLVNDEIHHYPREGRA